MNGFIVAMLLGVSAPPVAPEPRPVVIQEVVLSPFEQAKKYTLSGSYEESIIMLTAVNQNKVNYNEYCFLMAVNHFALNNKKEAEKWIKNINDSFDKLTRRHSALVYAMEQSIKEWKEGDLADIERDMMKSADRLKNSFSGKKTQKIQDDIVKKLDKLIKDQEDKDKADADAAAKAAGEPFDPKKHKIVQGSPSDQPAPDSIIMGGKGEGKVDEVKLRKIAETWGTMPPAARAKVIQEITRDLPPKFEEMIKNYFDALNKHHNITPQRK